MEYEDPWMHLCTDCQHFRHRTGRCESKTGVWHEYRVPLELVDRPVRCPAFKPVQVKGAV